MFFTGVKIWKKHVRETKIKDIAMNKKPHNIERPVVSKGINPNNVWRKESELVNYGAVCTQEDVLGAFKGNIDTASSYGNFKTDINYQSFVNEYYNISPNEFIKYGYEFAKNYEIEVSQKVFVYMDESASVTLEFRW